MNRNYSLAIRSCRVTNLDVNHSFDFLKVYMNTFADSIEIVDTEMTNITGSVLPLDKEGDDLGVYNVENVTIKGSRFSDIQGAVASVYRGGTDESTFGPIVVVDGSEFSNVGLGNRNRTNASLRFHGVQKLRVSDSTWTDSAPLDLHLTNGEPITVLQGVVMKGTDRIRVNSDQYGAQSVTYE